MMENGEMIKLMDLEDIITVMVQHTKENGKMINKKVLVKKLGQMVQNIKDIIQMGKKMVKEYLNLLMVHIMRENSIKMIYMEKVIKIS